MLSSLDRNQKPISLRSKEAKVKKVNSTNIMKTISMKNHKDHAKLKNSKKCVYDYLNFKNSGTS